MIYSEFSRGEEALVLTISEINGRYVKVGITEEEMFRAILGDQEFERRRALAYEDDFGHAPPPPPKPAHVESPEPIAPKRYIDLLRKAVGK